jgi:hypothetical protein
MIDAIGDLRREWQSRADFWRGAAATASGDAKQAEALARRQTFEECLRELNDAMDGVQPRSLNEASNGRLHRWAGRMVHILDLMIEVRAIGEDESAMQVGRDLGRLAEPAFVRDVYDLFKQLADRRPGA